jgi:excisionase family DNA binding protein
VTKRTDDSEQLFTPGEIADLFRVDPKTVTRWAATGRLLSVRTPGGHRRFREGDIKALLNPVDDGQWAVAVAQRQAQALAANYGDTDVSPTETGEGGGE